ncbi:DinI-like family protein [Citrobacter farmeri]|uniref:DinI-like family protein n=1 Tax=Citrobacter farmeri TaxID=67824 RepID=UPI001904B1CC|nr:DinI-like family protein [Citrobacter farmeri]
MRNKVIIQRDSSVFPDAVVRVKPMMTLPAISTEASKLEKKQISSTVEEMFEESDMWLVSD